LITYKRKKEKKKKRRQLGLFWKRGRKGGSAYSGVEKIGAPGEEEKKEEISQNYEGDLYLLYCF
jgi:hypothetical protein